MHSVVIEAFEVVPLPIGVFIIKLLDQFNSVGIRLIDAVPCIAVQADSLQDQPLQGK